MRTPGKGALQGPEQVELQRKTGKEAFWSPATRSSIKDSDRVIIPAAEVIHVPEYLSPLESPQAKQPCHLHTQLSLGQSCHWQNVSSIYAHRVTLVVPNSLWPCRLWLARLLWQRRGFFKQEWSRLLPHPSRALYFLLLYLQVLTWCCQNMYKPRNCIISTPGPHIGKPKSSRAAPGTTPVDNHMQMWK